VSRYRAFVSYSRADSEFAHRLHRWLEEFRIPLPLPADAESEQPPQSFGPCFVDVAELAAGSELSQALKDALDASEGLIVVCSASSARSDWVEAEIVHFCSIGRSESIVPILAPGASYSDACLPRALRFVVERGAIGTTPIERIAADTNAQGEQVAFIALVAGLLGVGFNDLSDRHAARQALERRKRRRLAAKVHTHPAREAFAAGMPELALKHALACVIEGDDPTWSEAPELEASAAEYACSIADRKLIRLQIDAERSTKIDSMMPILGGRCMLVGSLTGGISVWDAESGNLVAELVRPDCRHGRAAYPVAKAVVSPDCRTLAIVHQGGRCSLWSTDDWTRLAVVGDGPEPMDAIAFTHDGRSVAIGHCTTGNRASTHSTLFLVDIASGTLTAESESKRWDIADLRYSDDDSELVVLTRTGAFLHLLADTARLVGETAGRQEHSWFGALSPDALRAVTLNAGEPPMLWSRGSGEAWRSPAVIPHGSRETLILGKEGSDSLVLGVEIAPDWTRACVMGGESGCVLWDLEGIREIRRLGDGFVSARFSPRGRWLLLEEKGRERVHLFDGRTGEAIANIGDKVKRVHLEDDRRCSPFSPDEALFVLSAASPPARVVSMRDLSADIDGTSLFPVSLRLYDAATGSLRDEIIRRDQQIDLGAFAASGRQLWFLVDRHELRIRRVDSDRCIARLSLAGNADSDPRLTDTRLCFSPDGSLLAAMDGESRLRLLDPVSGHVAATIELGTARIGNFAFGSNQALVVTCFDGSIRVFEPASGRPLGVFSDHPCDPLLDLLAVSADGARIACASAEDTQGPVAVRDLGGKGEAVLLAAEDRREIRAICFAPGSERLALVDVEGEVAVWDVVRRQEAMRAEFGFGRRGLAVAFANGGRTVVAADAYGEVRSLDALTGSMMSHHEVRLQNRGYGLEAAAFTPDGARLVAAEETVVHVIDVETGAQRVLGDDSDWAFPPMAVSPSGRLVATGAPDGAPRLWRVRDGKRVGVLWRHTRSIVGLAFSTDERMLASVDANGEVRTWDIQAASLSGSELTAWLCRHVDADLSSLYGRDFENMLLRDVVPEPTQGCDLAGRILTLWPELREMPIPQPIRRRLTSLAADASPESMA
jgi:WD40 repeat protein